MKDITIRTLLYLFFLVSLGLGSINNIIVGQRNFGKGRYH